jgi:hypothetical protein
MTFSAVACGLEAFGIAKIWATKDVQQCSIAATDAQHQRAPIR